MPFGPAKKFPSYGAGAVQSQPMMMPGQAQEFDDLMGMLNQQAGGQIKAPKDRGMFGRFQGFNPLRFDPDKGVGEGNRLYALGAALAGMGTGDPGLTASLLEPKLQQNRERVMKRDEEAKRQQMMQQLQGMPGLTEPQRMAAQYNPEGFMDEYTKGAFQGSEDLNLPSGMYLNPETGRPEYFPEYIEGQRKIAEARGGNQNNVQSVFTGEDGMQYIVRRDGSFEPLGVKARNPYQIADVGGVPTAIDRQTGASLPITTPEAVGGNKATIETITEQEKFRREAQQNLPKDMATINRGVATLEALKQSPGFDTRYGLMSVIPVIPGTQMADTQALINQIGGQAFLTAFESLKGGGQITEVEGTKATQAITILTTQGIRPETAAKAIEDLISIQKSAAARMQAQASASYGPQGADAAPLIYNPATGEFE